MSETTEKWNDMSESIDKKKLLDWIQYMLSECYGEQNLGEELFGRDGYREGVQLLRCLRTCVNCGFFD